MRHLRLVEDEELDRNHKIPTPATTLVVKPDAGRAPNPDDEISLGTAALAINVANERITPGISWSKSPSDNEVVKLKKLVGISSTSRSLSGEGETTATPMYSATDPEQLQSSASNPFRPPVAHAALPTVPNRQHLMAAMRKDNRSTAELDAFLEDSPAPRLTSSLQSPIA